MTVVASPRCLRKNDIKEGNARTFRPRCLDDLRGLNGNTGNARKKITMLVGPRLAPVFGPKFGSQNGPLSHSFLWGPDVGYFGWKFRIFVVTRGTRPWEFYSFLPRGICVCMALSVVEVSARMNVRKQACPCVSASQRHGV